jgi:hypothetical protein
MDLIKNILSMAYDLAHLETLWTVWNSSITFFGSEEVFGKYSKIDMTKSF